MTGGGSKEAQEAPGLSQGQLVRGRFLRHRPAVAAGILLALITALAFTSVGTVIGGSGRLVAAPDGRLTLDGVYLRGWWTHNWFANYPVAEPGGSPTLSLWPPAAGEHPFGQDTVGKDAFARVMRGTQQSLTVMFITGLLSTALGIIVGALAGYYRGFVDSVLMRLTDVLMIIPVLVLAAVLGRAFGGSAPVLAGVLGLVAWPGLARLVRGEFLSLREREFVDAARLAGAGPRHIIFRHILPNVMGVVLVNTTLLMSTVILLESSLSFLGFGIRPPDVSLGQIISEQGEAFRTRPWLFWWPGLLIVAIALCVNFLGDGLREAFDPRGGARRRAHRFRPAGRGPAVLRKWTGAGNSGAQPEQAGPS